MARWTGDGDALNIPDGGIGMGYRHGDRAKIDPKGYRHGDRAKIDPKGHPLKRVQDKKIK